MIWWFALGFLAGFELGGFMLALFCRVKPLGALIWFFGIVGMLFRDLYFKLTGW